MLVVSSCFWISKEPDVPYSLYHTGQGSTMIQFLMPWVCALSADSSAWPHTRVGGHRLVSGSPIETIAQQTDPRHPAVLQPAVDQVERIGHTISDPKHPKLLGAALLGGNCLDWSIFWPSDGP